VLDGGYVDVVDGREVEDYGFEGGFVGLDGGGLAATGPGVVPGAVLGEGWLVIRLVREGLRRGLLQACHRSAGWLCEFP